MTLKELADKVNLTEATVQKYEAGNIRTLDIIKLKTFADVLGIELEDLTPWKEDSEKNNIEPKQAIKETKIMKMYSQLTFGHKKAVYSLMESLLECQEKYNFDK